MLLEKGFETYQAVQASSSIDTLNERVADIGHVSGMKKFIIIDALAVNPGQRWVAGRGTEFVKNYVATPKVTSDALVSRTMLSNHSFEWSIDMWFREDYNGCKNFRAQLCENNVDGGFAVPIFGPYGFRGYFSFAGERAHPDFNEHRLTLSLLGIHAFERALELSSAKTATRATISPRERDVLLLAAEGMTAWDIGEKLKLSVRTVEVYLRSVALKLGASSKTQAVANGIRSGLIR